MAWNEARRQAHRTRTLIKLYGSETEAKKEWKKKLSKLNDLRKGLANKLAQLDFRIKTLQQKIEE